MHFSFNTVLKWYINHDTFCRILKYINQFSALVKDKNIFGNHRNNAGKHVILQDRNRNCKGRWVNRDRGAIRKTMNCLFNILFILGVASTLAPIHAVPELIIDTGILILVTLLILIVAKTGQKTNRKEGVVCVAFYIAYTMYIILR